MLLLFYTQLTLVQAQLIRYSLTIIGVPMRSVIRTTLACIGVVAVVLLTACSSPPPEVAFTLKVELHYANPACDQDPHCWLPTQLQPSLVSGESVSLFNKWPAKGDSVEVICETTGQSIRDYTGQTSHKWFGILVPTDKVVDSNTRAKKLEGGRLAYVSAAWLAHAKSHAPPCPAD